MEIASFLAEFGDILSYPFMRNAVLASVLASIACGTMGTLAVQNRMTFLAGGASHAAYGGIGLALYFHLPVLPCTIAFSLAASLLMGRIALRGDQGDEREDSPDAAIGVLWAAGMAFGIILVEMSPGYTGELMGFLFGSILATPWGDIVAMAVFDLVLLLLLTLFRQGLWAVSLDREFAKARGLPVNALFLLLVGLIAVTAVMLIRVVGLILVLALLTIPPYLARKAGRTLYSRMAFASLFALLFCLTGLALAWKTDISSGAAIIAVATAAYCLAHIPLPHRVAREEKRQPS
jgi:zinc transport system permease protein